MPKLPAKKSLASVSGPRLRTVEKAIAAFPLNKFPKNFVDKLAQHLVYVVATKGGMNHKGKFTCDLQGADFEKIFADCIGGEWRPSNVGLDDVILGNTAWGIKTVKATHPFKAKQVRLISGRNAPVFSFEETVGPKSNPNLVGPSILEIWNERVSSIREKYKHLRTCVLVKSDDLSRIAIYEYDTVRFDPELFTFKWNKQNNLEGHEKRSKAHKFTWQPHGAQFTIVEEVPADVLCVEMKRPEPVTMKSVLDAVGYDSSWYKSNHDGESK